MKTFYIFLLFLMISGCQQKSQERCDISSLVIDSTSFPEGTKVDPIISPIDEEPKRSAGRYLYFGRSLIFQLLSDNSSADRADEMYSKRIKVGFSTDEFHQEWVKPDLSFQSQTADAFEYACTASSENKVCQFYARYETYVTSLRADEISLFGLSETDFYNAVVALDRKFEACLLDKK